MLLVEPTLSIHVALAQLSDPLSDPDNRLLFKPSLGPAVTSTQQDSPLQSIHGVMWSEQHWSASSHTTLPVKQGPFKGFWCVLEPDLHRMVAMGLGNLPVQSIGLPLDSTLLGLNTNRQVPLPQQASPSVYSAKRQLTQFFSGFLVAALIELQSMLNQAGIKGYVVGGLPRDILLASLPQPAHDHGYNDRQERRQKLEDVDVTLEADALDCLPAMLTQSKNFVLGEQFPEFGTAKLHYKNKLVFDLASTRQEVYTGCAALPSVKYRGVPIALDVSRRDFTVNTLALSINQLGDIVDHVQALDDLKNRRLQVLHPLSFFEDPSRILRAMKFSTRLNFTLTAETRYLLTQFLTYAPSVYAGGGDRIKTELEDWLALPETPYKTDNLVQFIAEGGHRLFNMALPGPLSQQPAGTYPLNLVWLDWTARLLPNLLIALKTPPTSTSKPTPSPTEASKAHKTATLNDRRGVVSQVYLLLWLRLFSPQQQQQTMQRLGLPKAQRNALAHCQQLLDNPVLATLSHDTPIPALVSLLQDVPLTALLVVLISLAQSDYPRYEVLLSVIQTYRRKWQHTAPHLTGLDVLGLGVPAGKAVGQVLTALRTARLLGQLKFSDGPQQEIEWVKQWVLSGNRQADVT
jgi:hypothetical protein